MNRTEVPILTKEASSAKLKLSFDKRPKKAAVIINVPIHPEKSFYSASETILDRNARSAFRNLQHSLPSTGRVIEIDIDKCPPGLVIPPLQHYAVNPPSDESKKYFGLRAPKEFHEQVLWLKHRSEIAVVSPMERAVAHQTSRPANISPPRYDGTGTVALSPIKKPARGSAKAHYFTDNHLTGRVGDNSSCESSPDQFLRNGNMNTKAGQSESSISSDPVKSLDDNSSLELGEARVSSAKVSGRLKETPRKGREASKVSNALSRKELDVMRSSMRSQNQTIEEMLEMEPVPLTPRSRYIQNCIRSKLNPRAFLILRKSDTTELLLSHMGIGDKMGKAVADSFKDLPQVKVVDISDNNFTDKSLAPIIHALHTNMGVEDLNVSQNSVGTKSSQALAAFLADENCKLKTLCAIFSDRIEVEALEILVTLKTKTTLTYLDLSNNLLGVSETLNVVKKDIITGGKALAQVLASPTCVLQTLKVGWNMIRVTSAVEFSRSLSRNSSLTHLDLNFNAIGSEGGIALGHSLLENKTLRALLVSTNGLDATACLTISAGAMENKTLRELVLDGNAIHDQGAHGAMLVSVMGSNNLRISLQNCNVGSRDKNCDIDFTNICKSYELYLNDPYQRAVAILLLRIVASHHTYLVGKCSYEERKGSRHLEPLNLIPCWLNDKSAAADTEAADESRLILQNGLQRLLDACSDRSAAKQFFAFVDTDHSGEIDRDEFGELLASIGIDLDNERLDAVFDQYDLDRGGTIGITEFFVFLKRERPHAERRLLDLTHAPALCCAKSPKVRLVEYWRSVTVGD
jgi:Ran GTPase-activating protein (RanGAP) involved in mRNA processing and transport